MSLLYFEDFVVGERRHHSLPVVRVDDVIAFAREYDAQPMHLGESDGFYSEHIGSGWHTCCLTMRAIADSFLTGSRAFGAPGIDKVEWRAPLRPGDQLSVTIETLDKRQSRSRPEMGLVQFGIETTNQSGTVLMRQVNWVMFGTHEPPLEERPAPIPRVVPSAAAATLAGKAGTDQQLYFDDLTVGDTQLLGSHTFLEEDIITFARAYDPQSFHTDPAAARDSFFGSLCASGWHTAAIWMKKMVERRNALIEAAMARDGQAARLGPSPGFQDLKWIKPVRAGDTLTYRSRVSGKRPSASRPQWGIVSHHNTAHNQHGECVFAFDGVVFWERKP
ncbi:MaoC/PaaZ C-terminal domain-containing protein [Chelatococcus asaccharovorans]|uniref:MaoC/PaaZ C-terminal domain-containing protein n=1 Tax=Chelatococcus asaccharovorans TaxID=28210 RepID=UPI00224C7992|nr:MaoC/PaaZ C-terminal domain-containing protein [Chelatococcus asaccharovorans]CAH1663715.1 Acyl dehydratase [Chelatococcus asaccharovorans]CAH1682707.1 Acyl dehydratase [Chelatococcus asaccharovorans]